MSRPWITRETPSTPCCIRSSPRTWRPSWRQWPRAGAGAGLPQFVEREFREFLTCGVSGVCRSRHHRQGDRLAGRPRLHPAADNDAVHPFKGSVCFTEDIGNSSNPTNGNPPAFPNNGNNQVGDLFGATPSDDPQRERSLNPPAKATALGLVGAPWGTVHGQNKAKATRAYSPRWLSAARITTDPAHRVALRPPRPS